MANYEQVLFDIEKTLHKNKARGASFAIFDEEKIIYSSQIGVAEKNIKNDNKKIDRNITSSTKFMLGDMAKVLTAIAIMKFVEDGKIALTDDIKKYLPEFSIKSRFDDDEITIADLLKNRSGLPSENIEFRCRDKEVTEKELLDYLKEQYLVAPPKMMSSHSELAYILLGKIIEKISEKKYCDFLEENIFKPLDIKVKYVNTYEDYLGYKNELALIDENYYKNVKVLVSNYLYRYQKISYLPENTMRIKSGVLDYINNDLDKYTTYLDGAYYFGSQSNPYLCLFKFDDSNASSFNILPDTKLIYSSAFKNSNLSSIYIPENIVSIGESVFENCSNLKTVEFAANSPITTLEYSLFKNCNNLEYVKNTNNILKIESRVFEGCTNLKEFVLPDNIESVGNSILYNGNKNLFTKYENGYYLGTKTNPYLWLVVLEDKDISTLTINKDTKYLAPYSCAYTTKLKELIVPSNIEEIGHGAFYNSKALEKVTFEDGVKKIDDKAFMRSENLKQTKFTNTINTIDEAAFAYCTNLDNINIPSSIFNLSNDLFNNCLSLKNLTIPNSIKYISNSCFLR